MARKRLGELLVESGVIDEFQLKAALGHQRQWGGRIGQTLVDLKLVTEPAVVSALARRLECEVARLDELRLTPGMEEALRLVPAALARKHLALPLESTRCTLTVAMADPANVLALDELGFHTSRRVKALLAGPREVARAVSRYYGDARPAGAIPVEFDRSFDPLDDDPMLFDQSAAKYEEEFCTASMRDLAPLRAVPPEPTAATPKAEAVEVPAPVALREAVARLADGAEAPSVAPTAVVAALTSVLVKRGLVTEAELVSELWRQRGAQHG
jgi:type IV pilus assembly protein PilB